METKLGRVRALLTATGAPACVLQRAAAVAWLTGGITNAIERGHPGSPLWIVVTPDGCHGVTTNVERPRLDLEMAAIGLPLESVPWHESDAFVRRTEGIAAARLADCIGDDPVLGRNSDDLVRMRLALLPAERARLAQLARDTAAALEEALRFWEPGARDLDIQACAAERLERAGALATCLFVGGDDRVERFRHPLPVGASVTRLVMAVAVAERGGLHAAATRFAAASKLPKRVAAAQDAALRIEATTLDACVCGATYGDVLEALDRAYTDAGHAGAWAEHYQGGPIGYRQREFELSPKQHHSGWFRERLEAGHALAWNPSVTGGGKCEDTFLLDGSGLKQLTDTGTWPSVDAGGRARPAVLDVSTGESA